MAPFSETFHQTLAIIPVCYNEFVMGVGYGWTAPILTKMKKSEEYTVEELSWLGSAHEFGRIIGPLLAAALLDRIGRRNTLILCALLFLVSWTGIIFVKSVFWICLFRFVFGIGNGTNDVASSIYLGENYPPKVRGLFCTFVIICYCLAELFQFFLASWLDYDQVAILNGVVALICALVSLRLVETPHYLLIKKRQDEAHKNFVWLRGTRDDSCDGVNEFEKIKQNIEEEKKKKASIKELFKARANYKSLIIVFMLNVFSIGTGYSAILSYMTIMFSSSGTFSEYDFTIFFGVVQLISVSCTSLYIEKFDRRVLVLFSFALITVIQISTAVLLYVQEYVTPIAYFSWLIFIAVSMYAGIYVFLFPVLHMIRGELFPQSIKAIGGFVGLTTYSIMAFATTRIFLSLADDYGSYSNFLLYAIMSLMAFIYCYFQLPETRGKMLVDIQKSLEK